jgi:hypothetical protein
MFKFERHQFEGNRVNLPAFLLEVEIASSGVFNKPKLAKDGIPAQKIPELSNTRVPEE